MSRQEAIELIEALYPIDSDDPTVKKVGRHLLVKALHKNPTPWRELPDRILEHYALLCQAYDQGEAEAVSIGNWGHEEMVRSGSIKEDPSI